MNASKKGVKCVPLEVWEVVRERLLCFVIRAIVENAGNRGLMFLIHLLTRSSLLLRLIIRILADMISGCMMTLHCVGGYRWRIWGSSFGFPLLDTMGNSHSTL